MNREVNLENYLKIYCGRINEKYDFYEIYENIKRSVQKIWQHPRLDWFTDHGVEHSERIIFHLNRLSKDLLQDPNSGIPEYGLVPSEVFLLLASAWIHDVGMQDLTDLNGLSVDQMDDENAWDYVRKRHPQRSYDIVMDHAAGSQENNEFWLGIKPQPQIHAPLALISIGHGSEYFDDVAEYFRENLFDIQGKGQKIRGELLTALLLIADELDLHSSRAIFKENYPLSKVSKLHHYRHHYIQKAEVIIGYDGKPETDRTICITYRFPEANQDDHEWTENLQKWVKEKIKKEAQRTIAYLRKGFDGHFSWSDPLIVSEVKKALPREKKCMEKEIQHVLKSMLRKVIDWKDIIKELSEGFKKKEGAVVCLNATKDQGAELFVSFIEGIFCAISDHHPQIPLAILNFSLPVPKYHSLQDVIYEIEDQLGIPSSKQELKNDMFIDRLKSMEIFSLVILQGIDAAEPQLLEDIYKTIISKCEKNHQNFFLLITTATKIALLDCLKPYILPDKYEKKDIYEYFIELGNAEQIAMDKTEKCLQLLKQHQEPSALICIQIAKIINDDRVIVE